jgi:Asp-tRNA(Asn)/Glu-tRNA(Gln) amidotransferase A subunit family amidase
MVSDETTPVNDVMADIVSKLKAAGVEVVNITDGVYDALEIAKLDVQAFEFREQLDSYLAAAGSENSSSPISFKELYRTGKFLVISAQYQFIRRASHLSTSDPEYLKTLRKIQDLKGTLANTFTSNNLDAIIYPQQKNLVVKVGSPSQSGRNGILAALTNYPVVCVPAGFSPPSLDAPVGVPVGMEILGRPWSEDRLLDIARHINELGRVRKTPPFADRLVEPKCYERVPSIAPNVGDISGEYPLGVY